MKLTIRWNKILWDLVLWAMGILICTLWRVVANKMEVEYYIYLFLGMMGVWIITGLLTHRYVSILAIKMRYATLSWVIVVGMTALATAIAMPLTSHMLSPLVAYWMLGIMAVLSLLHLLLCFYWRYAQHIDDQPVNVPPREEVHEAKTPFPRSEEALQAIQEAVREQAGDEVVGLLMDKAYLDNTNTIVIEGRDLFPIRKMTDYRFQTIIDLTPMNNVRGLNKRFCLINQKLPDNGQYVTCFLPEETVATRLLNRWPRGIRWVMYSVYFFCKRVLPRLLLTSRLYFDATEGQNRLLSETEALGRLYYCGFRVEEVVTVGDLKYIFARRDKMPQPQERKLYGPLIKLPRVCKDRKIVYFYKVRTMHPYAEYIQNYVFDRQGGMDIADKANHDFRITSWGRVFRKYWIDELPMLVNLLKGDLKLVGVRPLSRSMFNTYPEWLQQKRTSTKPGLIPPFYIDHPKTFDELFASEDRYLTEYLEHPVRTDIKYFFRTVYAILFKRMHSA